MLDNFMRIYREQLIKAVTKHPDEYAFGLPHVDTVCERMRGAFERHTFNKEGYAVKETCKVLGIKYTYEAINAYLAGKKPPCDLSNS